MDPLTIALLGGGIFAGMTAASVVALKGWQGWLDVKRLELAGTARREPRSPAGDMIEIADLKERIRKLEAIAACVDL